ncbi:MAG: Hsp20/alpha crystallin family protein [Euryarchaeota archaeon]|nr:Hsp20/alpha crystallin family protein [Euryarchaeota archaeon]
MVIRRRRRDDEWRDDWERRFFDEWDEFFDIDKEFRRMEEWMNRIMKEFQTQGRGEIRGPYVYGFSMRVGPDGKPHIEEFGNVPKRFSGSELSEYREPLVDVMEDDKHISVTAELPGVSKDDIELNLENDNTVLVLKVDTPERKYYKEVQLPAKVRADTVKATYKNGILDVVFEREKPKEKKGKRIKIE